MMKKRGFSLPQHGTGYLLYYVERAMPSTGTSGKTSRSVSHQVSTCEIGCAEPHAVSQVFIETPCSVSLCHYPFIPEW